MSSSLRKVVDVGMCGAGAAPEVGYMNGSDGATPLCHASTVSRACYDCHCSLLNSLCTRRCMPLTELLERRRGLFLDSASTLFFGGGRSGSGELPEDNSSSVTTSLLPGRMGSLPLFCLTGVQDGCSLMRFHPDPLPNEPAGDRSLTADGQHGYAIQPSVWHVLLASPPYLDASEGTGLQGTDLLGCWP